MYSLLLPGLQLPGVVQLLRLGGCVHSKVPQLAVGIHCCQLSQAREVGGKQCACTCSTTPVLCLLGVLSYRAGRQAQACDAQQR